MVPSAMHATRSSALAQGAVPRSADLSRPQADGRSRGTVFREATAGAPAAVRATAATQVEAVVPEARRADHARTAAERAKVPHSLMVSPCSFRIRCRQASVASAAPARMRPAVVAAASSSMGMDQVGSRAHNLSAAVAARDTVPGVVAVDTTENRCAGQAATARRAWCMSNGNGGGGRSTLPGLQHATCTTRHFRRRAI